MRDESKPKRALNGLTLRPLSANVKGGIKVFPLIINVIDSDPIFGFSRSSI
jgi:hypothetical protein